MVYSFQVLMADPHYTMNERVETLRPVTLIERSVLRVFVFVFVHEYIPSLGHLIVEAYRSHANRHPSARNPLHE
jgi:hypothetical protein